MNKEQLKHAIINLLYDLHSFNKLDTFVLNSINESFKIDAFELCELEGITYNLE